MESFGLGRSAFYAFIFFCCWGVISGAAEYAKYKDPKRPLNVRINDLLGRMTLAEKIGQMTQIERENATAEVINKYFIGVYIYELYNATELHSKG